MILTARFLNGAGEPVAVSKWKVPEEGYELALTIPSFPPGSNWTPHSVTFSLTPDKIEGPCLNAFGDRVPDGAPDCAAPQHGNPHR